MPQCAVATCRNSHRKTRGRRVRYHRFPVEAEARGRWVTACGRDSFNASTARVCSLHFSARSYERDVQHELLGLPPRSRLRRGAVPDRAVPNAAPLSPPLPPPAPSDVIAGIDVLLALGLTPCPSRRQHGEQQDGEGPVVEEKAKKNGNLNRMHIMDEECNAAVGNKAAAEDLKKEKLLQDGDSDSSGKENKNALSVVNDSLQTIIKDEKPIRTESTEDSADTPNAGVQKTTENEQKTENSPPPSENTPDNPEEPAESQDPKETITEGQKDEPEDHESAKGEENGSVDLDSGASSPQSATQGRSAKRRGSDSDSDATSSKKMKEIDQEDRERVVSECVETATSNGLEDIQGHVEKLHQEIQALDVMAQAKEQEWNSIIRLKKIKEEMFLRLQRKKQVMLLMMSSNDKISDTLDFDPTELRFTDSDIAVRNKNLDLIFNNVTKSSKNSRKNQNNLTKFLLEHQQQQASSTAGMPFLKNGPLMMVPVVSSSPGNAHSSLPNSSVTTMQSPIGSNTPIVRVPDISNRDKLSTRLHRPILPKPSIVTSPTSAGGNSNSGQNPIIGEGRQGPILDVRSIIADYRSKNPGDVPRRGRRLKTSTSPTPSCQTSSDNIVSSTRMTGAGGILSMASIAFGSGSQMRPGVVGSSSADMPDLGFLMNNATDSTRQELSRPSSADSSRSGAPTEASTVGGISFKDVLVQFAKMSQTEQRPDNKPPPYPEVTLHPVLAPQSPPHQSSSSSLLHGILTKSTNAGAASRPTTFSPTLARLLTAPERMPSSIANTTVTSFHHTSTAAVSISDLLSTSKNRNEITITPVSSHKHLKTKEEVLLEEQEDSADRLVIDESGEGDSRNHIETDEDQGTVQEISADDVPECQGCHQLPAQFVCAGCGNQWYCSRDCQVAAWDEHSEVCSG